MSNEYKNVCRSQATRHTFQRDDWVIRRMESDETRTGCFLRYCEDRHYAFVRWQDTTSRVQVANLMHLEDWRAARTQQATLKKFWK